MISTYRKSFEVVGYTLDGAMYCTEHRGGAADHDAVFLDMTTADDVCDVCFARLDGEA